MVRGYEMPGHWWEAVKRGSARHNADPFLVAAVMATECDGPNRGPWVAGQIGRSRYVGPCGFNRYNDLPVEVIWTPELQIDRACQVLAGDPAARLRRYNATWWENNYMRDVLGLRDRLAGEARDLVLARVGERK